MSSSSQPSDFTINISDGTSSAKFSHALDLTCQKFISSIKFSLIKSKYSDLFKKNPAALRNLHDQFCTELRNSISEDLDELSKEQEIEFLLNALDAIKNSQDPSQPTWRPCGDPEEDLRHHIYSIKLKEKEDLEAMFSKLKIQNEELQNVAAVNHAEIMHIKETNDSLHEKLTTIITSFIGSNQKNLIDAMDKK